MLLNLHPPDAPQLKRDLLILSFLLQVVDWQPSNNILSCMNTKLCIIIYDQYNSWDPYVSSCPVLTPGAVYRKPLSIVEAGYVVLLGMWMLMLTMVCVCFQGALWPSEEWAAT